MLNMEIRHFGQDEWNSIVSGLEEHSLMQTWEFGEAKAITDKMEVNRAIFRKNGEIIGAAQAMVRTMPLLNRGLVWINRAPIPKNKTVLQNGTYIEMLIELRKFWVVQKNMYLRVAPPLIASTDSYELFGKAGFKHASRMDGWVSEIIDLSYPTEEIRKNLHQKWRNCLNKAERLEVSCEIGNSSNLIDEFLSDYNVLLNCKGFKTSVTEELITIMQNFLPEQRKMLVFSGRHGGNRLGSVLIANYGKTCMYLAGATNVTGRKINVSHYLLWKAICEMKKRGYKWFDVGGTHPDNTPRGILHFKRGLGGEIYELMGEVEAYKNNFLNKLVKKRVESVKQSFVNSNAKNKK